MPTSVRTKIPFGEEKEFKNFLSYNGLEGILVGNYIDIASSHVRKCLCYAYPRNGNTETLSFLILSYGSIDNAYYRYTENRRNNKNK